MQKAVIVLILLCFPGGSRAEERITITYFQAAPHIMYDSSSGEISGALFELLEDYLAPEMGVAFDWDETPACVPRQLSLLEEGERDAAALLIYTPERAEKMIFTRHSFAISRPVLGVLTHHRPERVERVEDILGLKIGWAQDTYVSPFMRDERIQFEFNSSAKHNQINLKKLINGRIDCIYVPDKASLLMELKLLHLEDSVRIMELPEKPGTQHVVFSKKNAALAKRFDEAYERIDGDGRYLQLMSKYLDVSRL
jgi:polar amino acid transport system substrate-binding protein